jgi:hypothetical protein
VVLADAEDVEPGLVGELGGGEDLGIALGHGNRAPAVRVGRDVAEGVEAEFQGRSPEELREQA